jgi:hypothetical protein
VRAIGVWAPLPPDRARWVLARGGLLAPALLWWIKEGFVDF